MLLVAITIALALLVLGGVAYLWRSTPSKSARAKHSADEGAKDSLVDASPTGFGGGNAN